MKKLIITALLAGSVMSILGANTLFAQENQKVVINQKAKMIVLDAKVKGDKLIEDAKIRAKALIQKAKEDAEALKEESAKSMKDTTDDTKALAKDAIEKAKAKSQELAEKTKALPQVVKQGVEDKYVYTKDVINKSYKKSKDAISDVRIHAAIKYEFLMSKDIHSMKIDVDVKDGVVELFGKVKSEEEASQAMSVALSTKGVRAVKSFFVIEE